MSRKAEFVLTQEQFDRFLARLDSDRERAGEKYEALRHKLITFFRYRDCPNDESLADETIDRVVRKQGEEDIQELAPYTLAVARRVASEAWKREKALPSRPPAPQDPPDWERQLELLSGCLNLISEKERVWILDYYQHDKSRKIADKRRIAARLGIEPAALRVRAYRIRRRLEECVTRKLNETAEGG